MGYGDAWVRILPISPNINKIRDLLHYVIIYLKPQIIKLKKCIHQLLRKNKDYASKSALLYKHWEQECAKKFAKLLKVRKESIHLQRSHL